MIDQKKETSFMILTHSKVDIGLSLRNHFNCISNLF